MTRCRRKPLEFECWTWDGSEKPELPGWITDVRFHRYEGIKELGVLAEFGSRLWMVPGDTIVKLEDGLSLYHAKAFAETFEVCHAP